MTKESCSRRSGGARPRKAGQKGLSWNKETELNTAIARRVMWSRRCMSSRKEVDPKTPRRKVPLEEMMGLSIPVDAAVLDVPSIQFRRLYVLGVPVVMMSRM